MKYFKVKKEAKHNKTLIVVHFWNQPCKQLLRPLLEFCFKIQKGFVGIPHLRGTLFKLVE